MACFCLLLCFSVNFHCYSALSTSKRPSQKDKSQGHPSGSSAASSGGRNTSRRSSRAASPSQLTVFDQPAAEALADRLLTESVIKAVDWTPLSSATHSGTEVPYPDIVHYSTSSLPNIEGITVRNIRAIRSSISQDIGGGRSLSTHPESVVRGPLLKRNISAPQFSLGYASPIDVQMLKNELHKQMLDKYFDIDSSDDSQTTPRTGRSSSLGDSQGDTSGKEDGPVGDSGSQPLGTVHQTEHIRPVSQPLGDDLHRDLDMDRDYLSNSSSCSSSSTVKGDESPVRIFGDESDIEAHFDPNVVVSSSPKKGKSPGPQKYYDIPTCSSSTSYAGSSSSGGFHNSDANFYCFTDGQEFVNGFMRRMTEHLDEHFYISLDDEMRTLKRDNFCFGFQYAVQNIEPGFILKVLSARRQDDSLARRFLIPAQQNSEYGLLGFTNPSSCFGFF